LKLAYGRFTSGPPTGLRHAAIYSFGHPTPYTSDRKTRKVPNVFVEAVQCEAQKVLLRCRFDALAHRRTAWGVLEGKRRPQRGRPPRKGHKAVSVVARLQGFERSGMAGPNTLWSRWPPLDHRPCLGRARRPTPRRSSTPARAARPPRVGCRPPAPQSSSTGTRPAAGRTPLGSIPGFGQI
jgi:hypothetical protein